jgi:hypothetical protein
VEDIIVSCGAIVDVTLGQNERDMSIPPRDPIPPWVPATMIGELDLYEFSADPDVLVEREMLSIRLEANVAAYRSSAKGHPHGLCSVFRAATLTERQFDQLRSSELRFPDVAFVAYRKPLLRHDESETS